jgi:hypothetical protein
MPAWRRSCGAGPPQAVQNVLFNLISIISGNYAPLRTKRSGSGRSSLFTQGRGEVFSEVHTILVGSLSKFSGLPLILLLFGAWR